MNGRHRDQESAEMPGASLSIVVVGTSSETVSRTAAQALNAACHDLGVQFILVAQEKDPSLAKILEKSEFEFVRAPSGSSRAEMCDLGMRRAVGHIVAIRDDVAIGDATWVNAYRNVLSHRSAAAGTGSESVIMDTQVVGRGVLADGSPNATVAPRAGQASVEMIAAL